MAQISAFGFQQRRLLSDGDGLRRRANLQGNIDAQNLRCQHSDARSRVLLESRPDAVISYVPVGI